MWRAEEDSGAVVALKILDTRKARSERYQRFAREVEQMRALTAEGFGGVLPLIDAGLPENTTSSDPAWLAMPLATPMVDALGPSRSLSNVVQAVATVAHTLSRLAARYVHHRDVKPDNLYQFDGSWVLGDLGLISVPDVAPLTVGDRSLGPRYFLAPEMIESPDSAEGSSADVYCLAKTLWVLATGQNVPPPGEHRRDTLAMTIAAYVDDSRAPILDRLVERATKLDPSGRPTPGDFADELSAWLSDPVAIERREDLSAVGTQIGAVLEPQRRAEESREQLQIEALDVLNGLGGAVADVASRVDGAGVPIVQHVAGEEAQLNDRLTGDWVMRHELFVGARFVKAGRFVSNESLYLDNSSRSLYLWSAVAVRADSEGLVAISAAHIIGRDPVWGKIVWKFAGQGRFGSAQLAAAMRTLGGQLLDSLPRALVELRDALAGSRPRMRSAAAPPPAELDSGVTPGTLIAMVAGTTDIQHRERLDPFLGRWLPPISGTVANVSQHDSSQMTMTVAESDDPVVYMYFELRWRERLLALEPGAAVTVRGRLQQVSGNTVHLDGCELDHVGGRSG